MLTDEAMRERMINGWRKGIPETVCGNGSLRANSRNALQALPRWAEKYGIRTVCDAGAGDLWFARGIEWNVEYRAFDLIVWRPDVTCLDITTQDLPPCDLILCRMVLNHLDDARVTMALERFKRHGGYLAATQFNGEDLPKRSPQFTRLDLVQRLGVPLERVQDGNEDICELALWKL